MKDWIIKLVDDEALDLTQSAEEYEVDAEGNVHFFDYVEVTEAASAEPGSSLQTHRVQYKKLVATVLAGYWYAVVEG